MLRTNDNEVIKENYLPTKRNRTMSPLHEKGKEDERCKNGKDTWNQATPKRGNYVLAQYTPTNDEVWVD